MLQIRGVRLMGTHGVLESERVTPQPFEFDLDVHFDVALPGGTDDLVDTVDYAAVLDAAAAVVTGPWCALLERMALLIGGAVLDVDERIEAVDVTVRKLEPPVPYEIDSAGVRISVTR